MCFSIWPKAGGLRFIAQGLALGGGRAVKLWCGLLVLPSWVALMECVKPVGDRMVDARRLGSGSLFRRSDGGPEQSWEPPFYILLLWSGVSFLVFSPRFPGCPSCLFCVI